MIEEDLADSIAYDYYQNQFDPQNLYDLLETIDDTLNQHGNHRITYTGTHFQIRTI